MTVFFCYYWLGKILLFKLNIGPWTVASWQHKVSKIFMEKEECITCIAYSHSIIIYRPWSYGRILVIYFVLCSTARTKFFSIRCITTWVVSIFFKHRFLIIGECLGDTFCYRERESLQSCKWYDLLCFWITFFPYLFAEDIVTSSTCLSCFLLFG